MPMLKDWLTSSDWTQGAGTIHNEQLKAVTFSFLGALEGIYPVTKKKRLEGPTGAA